MHDIDGSLKAAPPSAAEQPLPRMTTQTQLLGLSGADHTRLRLGETH